MRIWTSVVRLTAAAAMMAAAMGAAPQAQEGQGGQLAVTVKYTGAGTVDKEHRIWVFLFDTPNISTESMPVATGVISENGGAYKFVGLPTEVYIAASYDEQGGYDMSGPPPSGTPVTIHGMASTGSATAVPTGGADATVTVTFDDSMRIP